MKKQFKKISLLLILFLYSNSLFSNEIDDCNWSISINNLPCANIYKTPNSSLISEKGIRKTIINKKK